MEDCSTDERLRQETLSDIGQTSIGLRRTYEAERSRRLVSVSSAFLCILFLVVSRQAFYLNTTLWDEKIELLTGIMIVINLNCGLHLANDAEAVIRATQCCLTLPPYCHFCSVTHCYCYTLRRQINDDDDDDDDKKLSYRRETARQLPTWRGLGPPATTPPPPLATPMRMVEFESHNVVRQACVH